MHSSEWRKRAAEIGWLAQKLQSLTAKQRLLAQQQKCLAMARSAEKQEQADIEAAGGALPLPFSRFDSLHLQVEEASCGRREPCVAGRPEPSELIKASPFLMKLWKQGIVSAEELERRAHSIELLKERLSGTPYHAERAAQDPDYWNKLYDARVNW